MEQSALARENAAFGRFYTSDFVGDALVQSMIASPSNVVDLGAGGGSLSAAAARRWHGTKIVTVDIDSRAVLQVQESHSRPRHTHIHADVLDSRLPSRLVRNGKRFDAAICNPPYIIPEWKASFAHILEEANLSCVLNKGIMIGADVLFLAQNLRVTRDRAELGLIVPDGIITGAKLACLRAALVEQHCIRSVVQLPRGCFKGTDAQAFILIFEKATLQTKTIQLTTLTDDSCKADPILIDAMSAVDRCDYNYYAARRTSARGWTLMDAKAEITRGSLQAKDARQKGIKCFHTSSFPEVGSKQLRLTTNAPKVGDKKLVIAAPGDILVARVDRNLHRKVAIVLSGRAVLTDCVFRIRVPRTWRKRVFEALSSPRGSRALNAVARGVGAKLLTKANLLQIRLS